MPFMRGSMPIRRTFYYLEQGSMLQLRECVRVFTLGLEWNRDRGAREFLFWHWPHLQYHNPTMQLIKVKGVSLTPFIQAFLSDGREVLFDLDGKSREQIVQVVSSVLGKTDLVRRREQLEALQEHTPADFGSDCPRQCMCEIQGQHPCTGTLRAPTQLTGKWRWNHNII